VERPGYRGRNTDEEWLLNEKKMPSRKKKNNGVSIKSMQEKRKRMLPRRARIMTEGGCGPETTGKTWGGEGKKPEKKGN